MIRKLQHSTWNAILFASFCDVCQMPIIMSCFHFCFSNLFAWQKPSILFMQIGASNLLNRTLYSKCAPTNCQSPSICINGFDTFGCTSSAIGLCCNQVKYIFIVSPAIDSFGNYANQKVLKNCIKMPQRELSTIRLSISSSQHSKWAMTNKK